MKSLNKNGLFIVFLSFFAFLIGSCSEDSNFNKLFIGSAGKDSFNYLYSKATSSYDIGKIDEALSYAEQASNIDSDHIGVNILLGNIYLNKTHMSVLNIIRTYLSNSGSSKDFNSFLIMFKDVLDLGEDNIRRLGDLSQSNLDLFKPYPLVRPTKTLTEVRSLDLPVMVNLAKLKERICRYVDTEDELLHNNHCSNGGVDKDKLSLKQYRQISLLWAFSHLVEAVTLATTVVYTLPETQSQDIKGKPALQLKAEALNKLKGEGNDDAKKANLIAHMDEYLDAISELSDDVDVIFNIKEGSDSLFLGLLADLETTAQSLALIVSNKESDHNYLKKMSDKIKNLTEASSESKDNISNDVSDSQKSYLVLKNKLMKTANKKIDEQISGLEKEKIDTPEGITTDQKNRLCEQYKKLTNSKDLPDVCK